MTGILTHWGILHPGRNGRGGGARGSAHPGQGRCIYDIYDRLLFYVLVRYYYSSVTYRHGSMRSAATSHASDARAASPTRATSAARRLCSACGLGVKRSSRPVLATICSPYLALWWLLTLCQATGRACTEDCHCNSGVSSQYRRVASETDRHAVPVCLYPVRCGHDSAELDLRCRALPVCLYPVRCGHDQTMGHLLALTYHIRAAL